MDYDKSIWTVKNYGSVKIKLRQVMDEKGINRNYMARKINARFEVIDKWYNGKLEKIDSDILARLCYVLNCRVEDLVEYVKEE